MSENKDILIIGKSSKLYQSIRLDGASEISTKEFYDKNFLAFGYKLIIVFSVISESQIRRLYKISDGKILIIGSCAAISSLHKKFKYSRIKKEQMDTVIKINNSRLKYLIFGEFYPSKKKGFTYQSNVKNFWRYCFDSEKSEKLVLSFFNIEENKSKMSNIFSLFDKFGAPYSSFLIKLCTSHSYGYSNAKLISNYENISILGSGMCAAAVSNFYKNATYYAPKSKHMSHDKIKSKWRPDPIISNKSQGGLSNFYHGVTPIKTLINPLNKSALKSINIYENNDYLMQDGYFVPRFIPRPKKLRTSSLDKFNLKKYKGKVFLCLSVVGNLEFLIKENYIESANISDDIVFRLGGISNTDYERLVDKRTISKKGCYFSTISINSGHISFRPVFLKKIEINFIDIKKSFIKDLRLMSIIEKILRSLYLRFGLIFFKPKLWECYVQTNIRNAYKISRNGIYENPDNKAQFIEASSHAREKVLAYGFKDFTLDIGDIMSGIHLGYDRAILKDIPNNIIVLDTSLNKSPGLHPTLESFCNSYNNAKNSFFKHIDFGL